MALAARSLPQPLKGSTRPRLSPPVPARSDWKALSDAARAMDLTFYPWQEHAARYLTARGRDGLLYPEVCIVVARQNGKTTLMKPYIVQALRNGKRIMHIAQVRELPRIMFGTIADALSEEPDLFPKRRGRTIWPRYGSGQEEITLANGGTYRIAAASRGGARGHPNDIVIIDELREMDTNEVIAAAEPTMLKSPDPQIVYLSNAGTDTSVVLNDVASRAGQDESLAYLEWSASPGRAPDDVAGWAEANPSMGHDPAVLPALERAYRKHRLAGTLAIFEVEYLCRWQNTTKPGLVDATTWSDLRVHVSDPIRPRMAVSLDPSGRRASVALAWVEEDKVRLQISDDIEVEAGIDTNAFGTDLARAAIRLRVPPVGHDPETEGELAKYLRKPEGVTGAKFTAACAQFVQLAESGRLRWSAGDREAVNLTDDVRYTVRKADSSDGTFRAVKAKEDRPITSVLAAIRAVWLASGPKPAPARIY